MATKTEIDTTSSKNHEDINPTPLQANNAGEIHIPDDHFVGNATLSQDGQNLILNFSNDSSEDTSFLIQDYFAQIENSSIQDSAGNILTEGLVNSFIQSSPEYAQANFMTDKSPIGAIEELKGDATVTRTDGSNEEITLGTPIYEGDVIQTSSEGAVNIVFVDETSMGISESARISIDNYSFDTKTESGETDISVLRGVFVYTSGLIGRDDPDDVTIDTPVGSIGIRGTIIAGKINPEGESEISVLEGAIVVSNGTGETTLSQKFETVKLLGFKHSIEHQGVESASEIGKTYGSVRDVLPKLFSSINDSQNESTQQKENTPSEKNAAEETINEESDVEGSNESENTFNENNNSELNATEDQIEFKQVEEIKFDKVSDAKPSFERKGRHGKDSYNRDHDARDDSHYSFANNSKYSKIDLSVIDAGDNNVSAGTYRRGVEVKNFDGDDDLINSNAGTDRVYINNNGNIVINNGSVGHNTNLHTISSYNFSSVDALGDINNDGYTDVIAGIENLTAGGQTNAGGFSVILGVPTGNNIATITPLEDPSPSQDDLLGNDVSGIGDFNGDGKSDVIIGSVGNDPKGSAFIYWDLDNHGTEQIKVDGTGSYDNFGKSVDGIGDFNGDGLSDVLIGSDNGATVFFGRDASGISSFSNNSLGTNGFNITGDFEVFSAAGDINGDGLDDFAISIRSGANNQDVDTYVVYGNGGTTDLNLTSLGNSDDALKIHHTDGAANGFNYQITSLGDIDDDGFDDLQIGNENGYQYIVHGQANANNDRDIITDNLDNTGGNGDGNGNTGAVNATQNNQSLVGDVDFHDQNKTDISMKGGGSDNTFVINNNSFTSIDGGKGIDTISLMHGGVLDFTDVNYEKIEQIEAVEFGGTSQILKLSAENIFNMLKSSDTGELFIKGDGYLKLKTGTSDAAFTNTEFKDALNDHGTGATLETNKTIDGETYTHFEIGGYNLYIDTDIGTEAIV